MIYVVLQAPFGYTRKDVLLIGFGLTFFGIGLKSGLEVIPFFIINLASFIINPEL